MTGTDATALDAGAVFPGEIGAEGVCCEQMSTVGQKLRLTDDGPGQGLDFRKGIARSEGLQNVPKTKAETVAGGKDKVAVQGALGIQGS